MLEKIEILFVIFILLLIFYLVIYFGAKSKKKISQQHEIKRYLFGVRVLIVFIASVGLILWLFL
tara:strand:+ start:624 stop:815 length:192 start_codon:yes stop_codon:yes gene_type:complete